MHALTRGSISAKCIVIRRLPRRRVLQVHCALFRRSDGIRYTGSVFGRVAHAVVHTCTQRSRTRTRIPSKQHALVPFAFFFCVFVRRFTVRAPSALCVSHRPWGVPERLAGLCQRGSERERERERERAKEKKREKPIGRKGGRQTHTCSHRRGHDRTNSRVCTCVKQARRVYFCIHAARVLRA